MVDHFMQKTRELKEVLFFGQFVLKKYSKRSKKSGSRKKKIQTDCSIKSVLRKGFGAVKRFAKIDLPKLLIRERIRREPEVYKILRNKVKNKRIRNVLDSDLVNMGLNYGLGYAYDKLK